MTKRANGEGSIYFDAAKGVYVATLTIGMTPDGRPRRRKFMGSTKAEARARLDAAREKQRGGLPIPDERRSTGTYLLDWAQHALPGTVSRGTQATYERVLRLYVLPAIGHIPLAKLTPAHVADMLNEMEDRQFAPETRRLARAVLRRALRRAEQEGLLFRNVAAIADGPKIPHVEGRTLTIAQARQLLAIAATDRLEAAYVMSLSLGMRRGEVLGLRWSDLDLDASPATVTIRGQLQREPGGLVLTGVKTPRSRRTLHLPSPVVKVLREHERRQTGERGKAGSEWRDASGLVFTTPFGTPVDPRNFTRAVTNLCVRAEIGKWSPHELRHSCASLLLAMGVPLEVVSETLGHSSIRVTKDVYGHLQAPSRALAAEAMERSLWD